MKTLIPYILITILSIYVYSCANPGTPSGGPKDTIPPTLIESYPLNQSINFNEQEFTFVFDEKINADKVKSKLVITPFTENPYKVKYKKNTVTLLFEEPFQDSTTYTFNFSDGVVDLTEKNPVTNFTIAFSTGPYLDSINVSGKITNLYNNKNSDKTTISLYSIDDSLNILTGKPRYFTQTDTSGTYHIENIKNGYYRIYAFIDNNNNLTAETDEEEHGFLADSLDLNTNQIDINIPVQLINAEEFKYIRSKKTGRYYDILYNKPVDTFNITKLKTSLLPIPHHNLIKEAQTLRFYYDSLYQYDKDSLAIISTAYDSLTNITIDTTYIQFSESKRKPEAFNNSITPNDGKKIVSHHSAKFNFTKPLQTINYDSMFLSYDTLIIQNIPDSIFTWNYNNTEGALHNELNRKFFNSYRDSLLYTIKDTTIIELDTMNIEMDTLNIDSVAIRQIAYLERINTNRVSYTYKKGSFISIENDTAETVTRTFQFKQPENYGMISGSIVTEQTHYTLQLVSNKYEVKAQSGPNDTFHFKLVDPGKYTFRILIDANQDGQWQSGNLIQNVEPDPIYFYPDLIDIRANWEIENIEITF
ncbi:MAG: Ig-like domain-containing domain [Reichenbachiella sp.]